MDKINIGCGNDIKKGYINLDSHNFNKADIVFNLNEIYNNKKMPFKNKQFNEVYCSHVLEDFINPVPILEELIRICKNKVIIIVPCDTTKSLNNLYHKYDFTALNLIGFVKESKQYGKNYNLEVTYCKYVNYKSKGIYANICKFFRNLLGYKLIEYTFLKYIFPIAEIEIHYKIKNDYN